MNDAEWMQQFEAGGISNESFHHADHVKMAFLYLQKYPPLEALERFSSALARFAASAGNASLYNETVTWAFLLIIRERLAQFETPPDWHRFAVENPDLLSWENNILKKYYRPETLKSELAKKTFLFPDRL